MPAFTVTFDDENIYLVEAANMAEAEEIAAKEHGSDWKHIELASAEYLRDVSAGHES